MKLIFEVIRGNFHRSASSSFVHIWLSRSVEEELEEHNWGVEEELEGVEEEVRKSAGDEEKKRLEERSLVEQSHDEGEQNSDLNKTKQGSFDMPELGRDKFDDDNLDEKKSKHVLSKASTANNKETAENTSEASKPAKKKKKSCCSECEGFKQPNCEVCLACLDKPHNGGSNRWREKCARRICSA